MIQINREYRYALRYLFNRSTFSTSVCVKTQQNITIVTINRSHCLNAVNPNTATQLRQAFENFNKDDSQ
jgi:enoyl-CoA hydratase/carnithine racemase